MYVNFKGHLNSLKIFKNLSLTVKFMMLKSLVLSKEKMQLEIKEFLLKIKISHTNANTNCFISLTPYIFNKVINFRRIFNIETVMKEKT